MTDPSERRTPKPGFGKRRPEPRPAAPPPPDNDAIEATQQKRSRAVKLTLMGAGLLGVYGFTGPRSCPPQPDPADPNYAQLKAEYDQCRNRRSSSSSGGGGWGSGSKSTASRGGFGKFGGGGG